MLRQFYSCVCCQARPVFPNPYSFQFGEKAYEVNKKTFQSNEIKTTKYNVVNFIPKSIISQYQRLANFYFLIVAIISTIPDATPLNPAFIWTPLTIVLIISIIKQLYQDYSRYRTDREVNDTKQIEVMRNGKLQKIKWKNVMVGDLCLIKQQEMFPADLLLISSSNKDGIAYIQTASLDGQQTSKIRYSFQELNTLYANKQKIQLEGTFQAELPNASLTQFRATLRFQDKKLAVNDCSQMLFRGAKLKNTEWVWGLVIYTGQCSKIMMNGQSFVTKLSTVQKKLNYLLIFMLTMQVLVCLFMAFLSTQKELSMRETQTYVLWRNYKKNKLFVMNFLMFFVQYSSFIPISLIISIEIVKTAQSYFIDFDQLMFSLWRNKKVYARTTTLNQQLGQVEYVFCDKTGTLTKNQLKFHTAVIGNQSFQFQYNNQQKNYKNINKNFDSLLKNQQEQIHLFHRQLKMATKNDFKQISTYQNLMKEYLMCLLVCNNINTIENDKKQLVYQSQSPDQLALIEFAKSYNYIFLSRDNNSIKVEIQGYIYKIEVIARFGFTSDRKRMSVIIQWKGLYFLYSKGADNVILQRAKDSSFNLVKSINQLSSSGLRSLLIAVRLIDREQIGQFLNNLELASSAERQKVMDQYEVRFQNQLTILGATGMLDQLQSEVPQTLRDLQIAQIRVWMLTGDKLETAVQIGKSCGLIEPTYEVTIFNPNGDSLEQYINKCKNELQLSSKKHCLVVQGSLLAQIFNQNQIQKHFSQLTLGFSSVICCRMLPVQKSQAVRMVKKHLNKICLAIGDGGNDVSMIKQANIGIGVYGQQGMNAVQASDYAIPQFKMIWRLLFVHGRWNYIRISQMILYFCYKSILFTIPRLLFSFNNAYSGQPIYDDFYIALYNILFTSLPLIVRALFEQDVNYIKSIQKDKPINNNQRQIQQSKNLPAGYAIHYGLRKLFPRIYFIGQQNHIFNVKECLLWILQSVLLGVSLFLVIQTVFASESLVENGYNANLQIVSVTVYTTIIMLSTLKLCIQVRHWTKLLLITIIFLSLAPYFSFMWILNYKFKRPVQGVLYLFFTSIKTYFSILLFIMVLIGINGILIYINFHSHKILKRMVLALQEDASIASFVSYKKQEQNVKIESESVLKPKESIRKVEDYLVVKVQQKEIFQSIQNL